MLGLSDVLANIYPSCLDEEEEGVSEMDEEKGQQDMKLTEIEGRVIV